MVTFTVARAVTRAFQIFAEFSGVVVITLAFATKTLTVVKAVSNTSGLGSQWKLTDVAPPVRVTTAIFGFAIASTMIRTVALADTLSTQWSCPCGLTFAEPPYTFAMAMTIERAVPFFTCQTLEPLVT